MSVLFKTMVPAVQVQESDEAWNFDTLLRVIYNSTNFIYNFDSKIVLTTF